MDDRQGPRADGEACIACGHCAAVCPQAALDNVKTPLSGQLQVAQLPILEAATAAQFLRSRRSIRNYKPVAVERGKIRQLLDIARMAPTTGNAQGVSYYVIDRPETLQQVTATMIEWMKEEVANASPWAPFFNRTIEVYTNSGYDFVLRGAPCLIIGAVPKEFLETGKNHTYLSFSYAALYAPSLDLGTCIFGFSSYQPLHDLIGLPDGMAVTGGLGVGYPRYSFKRLVDRNPPQVTWQD